MTDMNIYSQLILLILIFALVLSITTTFLLYKRKKAPGALYFTFTTISCAIWIIGYIIEFFGMNLGIKLWGVKFQYAFGIPFVSSFWFAAALHYNTSGKSPGKFLLAVLNVIPFITMLLMWTNDLHHLVYQSAKLVQSGPFLLITKEIGIWYNINIIYSYVAVVSGTILLLYGIRKTKNLYRGQIRIFIIAPFLPMIANLLYVVGMNSFMRMDITPIAFAVSILLVWIGLFRYKLFDLIPAARNLIIESMENALLVLDDQNRVIDLNPSAHTLFDKRNLIGKYCNDLFIHANIKTTLSEIEKTGHTEIEVGNDIFDVTTADVNDGLENKVGVILNFYKITNRKKIEHELQELNSSKDKLFSIIAHDLKNPFFGVIGLSQLLIEDFEEMNNDEKIEMLREIHDIGHNAHAILENLLDWSRQQTGRICYEPYLFDISELININIRAAKQQAFLKNITVVPVNSEKNIQVFADENMINTVLRNLISNAIKFTHPGGKVVITTDMKEDFVEISVKDNGVGMSESTIKSLFKTDTTVRSFGTKGEKGTGLGLILCKEFVERNKGILKITSKENSGSTFTFSVPTKEIL
jgi:signal transduction histidine kinase